MRQATIRRSMRNVSGSSRLSLAHDLAHVLVTDAEALKRWRSAIVAFDKIVLHAGLLSGVDNRLPVNGSAADFCDVLSFGPEHLRGWEPSLAVLEMQQLNPAAVFVQHCDRVLPCLRHPIAIHLQTVQ